MPSTYSTSLKIELIPTGAQSGVWGVTTNANLGTAVEQAIVGTANCITADFTSNVATYTLTDTNALQTARAFCLNVTATLSGAGTINVPAVQKPYLVFNNSVGGFAVTVKVAGQTGVSIPNGKKAWLYNNGTDVGVAFDYAPTLALGTALPTTSGGTGLAAFTAGDLPYYASGTALSKLGIGTNGFVLTSTGSAPQWVTPSGVTIGTATNLAGGTTGASPYQSSAGVTTFLSLGALNTVVTAGASGPQYVAQSTLSVGFATAAGTATTATSATTAGFATTAGSATTATTANFATTAGSATTATTATNLAGGAANQVAYQAGAGTTTFLASPTVTGSAILWDGTNIGWGLGPAATSATNLSGGGAYTVVYQSSAGATAYLSNGTTGQVLTATTGAAPSWAAVPAGGLTYIYTTTPVTATDKQGILADTSGGAFTVTLPATPSVGAQVVVADAGANWGTNNLTVGRNGSTIGGLAQDLVCDISGVSVQFVYDGTTWEVYAQVGGQGGNVVTLDGVQTLTNKTLTDPKLLLGGTNGTLGQALVSQGAGVAPAWTTLSSEIIRVERTSNTAISSANRGNLIAITSGTFTQTFDACSSLGNGWFAYIQNLGTGDITLDPSGGETIDGVTSFIMYPNEVRLVVCNGTTLNSIVLDCFYKVFTASSTFTKPPGYSNFGAILFSGGGGGGSGRTGFGGDNCTGGTGGGAGAAVTRFVEASLMSTTTTVTIGAGGTGGAAIVSGASVGNSGTAGGNTLLGTIVTAFGAAQGFGGNGGDQVGGGGGGSASAGINGTGGNPSSQYWGGSTIVNNTGGGGGATLSGGTAGNAEWGGGGGGPSSIYGGQAGGDSIFGAGGGGGGGGFDSASNRLTGGVGGGVGSWAATGGTAGNATVPAGGNGATGVTGVGTGGGGGSYSNAGAPGAGGNGGLPSGGGGGGGGGSTSSGSGKGGDGGRGEIRIWGVV